MTIFLISLVAFCAWIHLVFLRGSFWKSDQRLGTPDIAPLDWPEIAIIIPARNESDVIERSIRSHLSSQYPGKKSIILIDDQSADGTADNAQKAVEEAGEENANLTVLHGEELAPGWSGKLWALHQGIEKAIAAAPNAKYFLLTDADILHAHDTLRRLVTKAEAENLSLTSLMARLDASGSWGAFLIPAFIFFFQKLYPFPFVNDADENTAAAAGGVILIRKDVVKEIGGIASIKSELIDDCALARKVKDLSPNSKIWLGLADEEAMSLRKNSSLSPIWNMVARTAFAQLGQSTFLLIGTIIGLLLVYAAPPLIALSYAWHENILALLLSLSAWGLMAYSYWPTLKLYDQEPWQASLLPGAAVLYAAMTISSALRHWRGQGGLWKGRHY